MRASCGYCNYYVVSNCQLWHVSKTCLVSNDIFLFCRTICIMTSGRVSLCFTSSVSICRFYSQSLDCTSSRISNPHTRSENTLENSHVRKSWNLSELSLIEFEHSHKNSSSISFLYPIACLEGFIYMVIKTMAFLLKFPWQFISQTTERISKHDGFVIHSHRQMVYRVRHMMLQYACGDIGTLERAIMCDVGRLSHMCWSRVFF